ncbi:hypothetical protein ACS0PU_011855 [Formica fusca]
MNKSLPVIRYERGVSIISVSRKWFSLPGSCPEDNNWLREQRRHEENDDAEEWDIIPRTRRGTPRRTANSKAVLGIIPEISVWCGTLVLKSLTRDRERRYGTISTAE